MRFLFFIYSIVMNITCLFRTWPYSCIWLRNIRSGLLDEIRWLVCMLKSHRNSCVSFSRTHAGMCIYHLFVWSNFNFLHISQWFILPTQSCLVLHSFCPNLLHSLIMWLIVSSLLMHNLHLLFCCVLFIFTLIWLVLMALFCATIRQDSVSLLRFLKQSSTWKNKDWSGILDPIYLLPTLNVDSKNADQQWIMGSNWRPP